MPKCSQCGGDNNYCECPGLQDLDDEEKKDGTEHYYESRRWNGSEADRAGRFLGLDHAYVPGDPGL